MIVEGCSRQWREEGKHVFEISSSVPGTYWRRKGTINREQEQSTVVPHGASRGGRLDQIYKQLRRLLTGGLHAGRQQAGTQTVWLMSTRNWIKVKGRVAWNVWPRIFRCYQLQLGFRTRTVWITFSYLRRYLKSNENRWCLWHRWSATRATVEGVLVCRAKPLLCGTSGGAQPMVA